MKQVWQTVIDYSAVLILPLVLVVFYIRSKVNEG
jgi:hypothetical protein